MVLRERGTLIRLSGSGAAPADPTADVRGLRVCDRDNVELGQVVGLVIDEEEGRVRFIRVEHQGFQGVERTTPLFVPVDAIIDIMDDMVHVGESARRVTGAPRYEPDRMDDALYFDSVYGYYGYAPFWSRGYLYPGFPCRRT